MIFTELKAAAVTAAIMAAGLAVGAGYLHWRDVQREIGAAPYRAQILAYSDAADLAAARAADAEKRMQAAQVAQEQKDTEHGKTIADLGRKLRDAGRLRDPGADTGRGGCEPAPETAPSAAPGAADDAPPSGLLSAEFSDMLRTWAAEADAVNIAYASCRADALNVRQ